MLTTIGESLTTRLTDSELMSAGSDESTAVTVKAYVPAVAGVPVNVPDVSSDRPGGKAGRRRELLYLEQFLEAVTEQGRIWHVRSLSKLLLASAKQAACGTTRRA